MRIIDLRSENSDLDLFIRFQKAIQHTLETIIQETDFERLCLSHEKSYSEFIEAFKESTEIFQQNLEEVRFDERELVNAGLSGKNLRLKIN